MSLPFGTVDTTFERFLQELPADFRELAFEFKAFTRGRQIKTPEQLLQVVMNYCGIDLVLRETAGNFTLLEERISDTAIQQRLKACGPWVKALLGRLLGTAAAPLLEGHLRFVVGDGSTVQGPGAKGTEHRLHLAVDLVRLELIFVKVTDAHEGESLRHYPLRDGDVVVVDRGYNSARALIECADRGVAVVVRYNPHSLNLYDAAGAKIDWLAELQATTETERCIPVRVQVEGEFIAGYLHGCRLPPAPAAEARRRVQAQARKKGRQAQARTLALAEWVLVLSTLPPAVLPTATCWRSTGSGGKWSWSSSDGNPSSISIISAPVRAARWPISISTASCSMPGCWRSGPGDGAVTIGIAWTARAARPRGGCGNCCARNWRPRSAACGIGTWIAGPRAWR